MKVFNTQHSFKPWQLSLSFHILFGLIFLALIFMPKTNSFYEIPIEISDQIKIPEEIQNLNEIKENPKVVLKSINEVKPTETSTREIFGTSRESYTDTAADGLDVKKGNTLTKEKDELKLEDSDSTALPTPTEEYLVSEMPVVISEVRPVYPKQAKDQQLEGSVALDVLIDDLGKVRLVKVIEGADVFRIGAIEAMKQFRFKPATVDGKSVAVRIRYTLNFKLEY